MTYGFRIEWRPTPWTWKMTETVNYQFPELAKCVCIGQAVEFGWTHPRWWQWWRWGEVYRG